MPTFTRPLSSRASVLRRSPHDREILRLALPALGALAAEPLYVLVDTAIVGHLGRPQIAALGLAGAVLSTAFSIFNFLTHGPAAVVARASGLGRRDGDRTGRDGNRVRDRAAAPARALAAAAARRDAADASRRPTDLRADDRADGSVPDRCLGARARRRCGARSAPDRVPAVH